jgi:hypothetical protein
MAETEHPHGQHETTDVDAWAVGRFGIALALTCILSLALLFGVFRFFQSTYGGATRNEAEIDPKKVFPQPQLQTTPRLDLEAIREAEERTLRSYGWVDQSKGVVRVPIDQAMDLLVKRGLPTRTSAPAASEVSMPTESGTGVAK